MDMLIAYNENVKGLNHDEVWKEEPLLKKEVKSNLTDEELDSLIEEMIAEISNHSGTSFNLASKNIEFYYFTAEEVKEYKLQEN